MTPKMVLVIEDDLVIRENLKEFLETEGFPVKTAANGREGLKLIHDLKGNCLVLLDLQMPVMSGEELLEELKQDTDPNIAQTPIVVLTARVGELKYPVAGFLRKPMDLDQLLSVVYQHGFKN